MASPPKHQILSLDLLVLDSDTQARVSISDDTVDSYAEVVEESNEWPFPAIDVFFDGSKYYIADGFHRYLTAQRLKRSSIPCLVHKGTAKEAKIFGMTANDQHGLRMSREDKRSCVQWLIKHFPNMPQLEICKKSGTPRRTVQRIVAESRDGGTKKAATASPGKSAEYSIPADPAPSKKVTQAERIKQAKSLIVQHLQAAVRGIDNLADMKPNKTAQNSLIKIIQGVAPKIREW